MENIDLSVIVPVYNVEDYLPDCVDSLLHQGDLRIEIILIDDGSTDRSGVIADKYAQSDNRIKVIHKKNKGASAARNIGLELAKGEYIAFVDSDDWVKENSLNQLYREAIKYQADMVMGDFFYSYQDEIINGPYQPVPKEIKNIPFSGKEGFINLFKANAYIPMIWNYIYRRKFLEKIKYRFEEGIMHEDELWTPIVLCQAEKMAVVDVDVYYYRQREGSVMKSTGVKKRLDALFLVTDRLMEFADRLDFSGEDAELKNWLYVDIYKNYIEAFMLVSKIKDSSMIVSRHHFDRFWRDSWEMMPEPQKICKKFYRIAASGLKRYIDWRISDWVASVDSQIKAGKKSMLIYNTIQNEDLSLKIEDVPVDWVITTDRRYLQQVNVVVFYLPDLHQELEYDLDKPEGQIWVSWYLEPEIDHPLMNEPEIRDTFDLWITHQPDDKKEHTLIYLCSLVDDKMKFND